MKKYCVVILSALSLGIAIPASAIPAVTIPPLAVPLAANVNNAGCPMVSANSAFTFVPSANVGVIYNCDAAGTIIAVNSGNTKGKYSYGGSSNGGSVKQCGTTPVSSSNGYSAAIATVTTTTDGCS